MCKGNVCEGISFFMGNVGVIGSNLIGEYHLFLQAHAIAIG